jgi:hypothetical protein
MWKVKGRWTPSDGKSSHCLWQGELKILILLGMFFCDVKRFDGNLVNSWIRQGVCMWLWAKLCQSAYIYCIHVACSGCNWIYINICVLLIHFTIYVVYTCIQILYFFCKQVKGSR